MQNYFSPSHIINICHTIKQSITKHTYVGDWYIGDPKSQVVTSASLATISELYY